MNYAGQDLKFKTTSEFPNFSLAENDFSIIIKNQFGRVVYRIKKEQCLVDSDGNYYFGVEKVCDGSYTAFFKGVVSDGDYEKQTATITDEQPIFTVGVRNGNEENTIFGSDKHKVHYEQVYVVNVDGDEYLADVDGNLFYTSDGKKIAFKNGTRGEDDKKIRLNMTGEQFKQLIEGRNPDGRIDTLQEMLDAAEGISDDKTINEEIDEKQEENEASDSDIDEIFDDKSDV